METEIEACCEPVWNGHDWGHHPDCEFTEELTRDEMIQELLDLRDNRNLTVPGSARFNELEAMIAGLKQTTKEKN